ncbi:MAG TPA: serine/threonine protein kinase, partial [Synechococcales cyanobacterium M55_K2018_004]|nr:serine/threonine protein kinase [Synechococcales cyanobacterium M55_K2018_004]
PPPSTGAAAPAQVMASTPGQPPASPPGRSLVELLGGAAFTGFEGGLLAIAILSLLGTIILSPLLWLLLMGGLIWGQSRRLIERSEMIAIAGGTLLLVWLAPWLNRVALGQLLGPGLPSLLLVAIAGALIAVVVTTLFRLIYLILSRVV